PVGLEPEVPVQPRGVVLLDDEAVAALAVRELARRLGGELEVALLVVFGERIAGLGSHLFSPLPGGEGSGVGERGREASRRRGRGAPPPNPPPPGGGLHCPKARAHHARFLAAATFFAGVFFAGAFLAAGFFAGSASALPPTERFNAAIRS